MDPTDQLLQDLLALPDPQWRSGLEDLCRIHPDAAAELRRRFGLLESCGVTASADAEATPGGDLPDRCGPYRLVRRLGGGGMGVVWLAVHEPLGRQVAVKMIRPERFWFDTARDRFRREVEAVARLQHPGCVQIHQVGEAAGVPYFAMEFVPGASCDQILATLRARGDDTVPARLTGADLAAALRQRGAQVESGTTELLLGPWVRVAVRIALAAAEALAHAHARGVVHRDLKPSNLMITPDGRVVVIDFGLAFAAGSSPLTREGSLLGSVPYMAPEQLRGEAGAIGERADVYALGVCLFELLTLSPPFAISDEQRLRHSILAGDCAPLRRLNPAVPRDLAVVVARAMHVDPRRRYSSMVDLAADLNAVLADRPILARRDSLLPRLMRWSRRRPALATALALMLVALAAAPAVISLAVADQRDRALAAEQTARRREYAAHVAAANAALLGGHGAEARLRLGACPEDLRGFEWHHLALALDDSVLAIRNGSAPVTAVALTHDLVAAGAADGSVRWFGRIDGTLRAAGASTATAAIAALAFDRTGGELFALDAGGTLRVLDVGTGQLRRQRDRSVPHERLHLATPADQIVSDLGGGQMTLLDPTSFAVRAETVLALDAIGSTDQILVGNGEVAVAGRRGFAILGLEDGRIRSAVQTPRAVRLLAAGPDLDRIAGTDGRALLLWSRGEAAVRTLQLGARVPTAALFLPEADAIVAACDTGEIQVLDLRTDVPIRTLLGHRGAVQAAVPVPGSSSFVTGGADGELRVWHSRYGNGGVQLDGVGEGRGLAATASGRLLTGSADAVARCIDPATGAIVWSAQHRHWVNAVAVTRDDRQVVTAVGSELRFWSADTGTPEGALALPATASLALRLQVDPVSGTLAVGGRAGDLTLIDPVGRTVQASRRIHDGAITEIVFEPARARVLTSGTDGRVLATSLRDASATDTICTGRGPVQALALVGDRLYTSEHAEGGVDLCERDLATGTLLRSHRVGDPPAVIRRLGNDRLVVGTVNGRIGLWDRATLSPVLELRRFGREVRNLVAAPDGSWLAAIGAGGPPQILHARGIAQAGPDQVAERARLAAAREHVRAAMAETLWPPAAERALRARSDLSTTERAAALSLLPPRNRWSLASTSFELATDPGAPRREPGRLQALFDALTEAIDDEVDAHGLYSRCSLGLVAVRLGRLDAALAALDPVAIDPEHGPETGDGWFRPAVHFVRGLAHWQRGEPAVARAERDALAGLVAGAFAADRQARLFLRELDERMR